MAYRPEEAGRKGGTPSQTITLEPPRVLCSAPFYHKPDSNFTLILTPFHYRRREAVKIWIEELGTTRPKGLNDLPFSKPISTLQQQVIRSNTQSYKLSLNMTQATGTICLLTPHRTGMWLCSKHGPCCGGLGSFKLLGQCNAGSHMTPDP